MRFTLALLASASVASAGRVSQLARKTRPRQPAAHISEVPASYREAHYSDEDFFATKSNDISLLEGFPERVREGVTAFHRFEFRQAPEHWPEPSFAQGVLEPDFVKTPNQIPQTYREAGYPDEDFFAPKAASISFLDESAAAPEPDHIVKFFRYEFEQHPDWFEASYGPSSVPSSIDDIPESFLEAHYPDEDFFSPKANNLEFLHTQSVMYEPEKSEQASVYSIGVVPESYLEALYRDQVAAQGLLQAMDNEVNGPKNHRHSSNVIGTRQEGRNFWTNTVQPNMKHYISSYDARQLEARRDTGGAFSTSNDDEQGPGVTQEMNCPDCEEKNDDTAVPPPAVTTTPAPASATF